MTEKVSSLIKNKHILICIDQQLKNLNSCYNNELEYVRNNFCGVILSEMESFIDSNYSFDTIIYLCGDIEKNYSEIKNIQIIQKTSCIIKVLDTITFINIKSKYVNSIKHD